MADVSVNPTASYTVAADVVGTVGYQRIKLDVGASGVTSGDVGATNPLPVTGTVLASGTVTVLGSVSVSGTAIVSVVPGVSVNALVTGVVSISVMPAVSGTVTVNGSVAVVPGVSVVAQVSGTVTIAPTTFTVNTLAAGASVNALVTGVVSVSVMPAISISVSAVLGTIITQLGTQVVTVVPGLSVSAVVSGTVSVAGFSTTAAPHISATGGIVWIAGGQSTTAFPVVITGTVTAGAGTTVVSGTITAIPIYSTTATPSAAGTGAIVWVANPGAAVATTVITVNTIAAGFSVNALVTGPISVSNVVPVVTQASASVTGLPVWLGPSQTVGIFHKGDAIAFSITTVSAPTVVTPALCDVGWLGTTVQTSMYVVPAGRTLEIQAIQILVANTAASIGIARGEVFVRMSLSSSVTVGPVVCYAAGASPTNATNAGGQGGYGGIGIRIGAGYSVGFAYKVTGGTGHIIGFVIQGVLF